MLDEDVDNKKGIYPFVLTRKEESWRNGQSDQHQQNRLTKAQPHTLKPQCLPESVALDGQIYHAGGVPGVAGFDVKGRSVHHCVVEVVIKGGIISRFARVRTRKHVRIQHPKLLRCLHAPPLAVG